MRAAYVVAALAGSAIAAPAYPVNEVKNVHIVVETVVETVYVTEGYPVTKPTPAPAAPYQPPAVTTVVYEEPAAPSSAPAYNPPAAPQPTPEPEPTPEPAPAPSPSPSPAPVPEAPSNAGYQAIVDEWRAKLGLSKLENDSKLQANAYDCVYNGNGKMVHKLNPGSYGQVLAGGEENHFKEVFVGGWLCEIPTLPGLDGVCSKMSEGWDYQGQTGHAKILTSPQYTKIGCAWYNNIWGCDLA